MNEAYIYEELQEERRLQVEEKGLSFAVDDAHTENEWKDSLSIGVRALKKGLFKDYRSGLIKLAALCIAAIASHDRSRKRVML